MAATILVVEDDAEFRQLLTSYLESDGHRVVSIGNGSDVVPMAGRHKPDLIILDLMMPEVGGVTALELLADYRRERGAGVLLLTGSPDSTLIRKTSEKPGVRYLPKPVHRVDVVFAVREMLLAQNPPGASPSRPPGN